MDIAIVDDDVSCVKRIKQFIARYQENHGGEYLISEYQDGLTFLEEVNKSYDLIFLDIDMPMMNGMNTARQLRERDENVCLIFITNMAQFAIKGYEVNALDFIVKPVEYSIFEFKMKKAVSIISRRYDNMLTLKVKNGIRRIRVNDIYYVEVIKHKLIYHTVHGDIEVWEALSDVEQRLTSYGFARCNISFLVNLRYVTEIQEDSVCVNGEHLKISRPKKKEFIRALMQIVGNT